MHLEDYSNIFCSTRTHNFQVWFVVEIQEILQVQAKLYLKMIENCGPAVTSHTIHNRRACIYLRFYSSDILVQVDWDRLDFQSLVNNLSSLSNNVLSSPQSYPGGLWWNGIALKWNENEECCWTHSGFPIFSIFLLSWNPETSLICTLSFWDLIFFKRTFSNNCRRNNMTIRLIKSMVFNSKNSWNIWNISILDGDYKSSCWEIICQKHKTKQQIND